MSENDPRIKRSRHFIRQDNRAGCYHPKRSDILTQSADVLIPSFSSDVVDSLPLYYRALAHHLAETGRAIIKEKEQEG